MTLYKLSKLHGILIALGVAAVSMSAGALELKLGTVVQVEKKDGLFMIGSGFEFNKSYRVESASLMVDGKLVTLHLFPIEAPTNLKNFARDPEKRPYVPVVVMDAPTLAQIPGFKVVPDETQKKP